MQRMLVRKSAKENANFFRIIQELPRAIHYQPWVTQGFHVYDLEYAFKIDSDYQNIADACQVISKLAGSLRKIGLNV